MIADSGRSVAFTGHRTYDGTAAESLSAAVERLYGRGFRTFLSGMAVGFDLAAAEVVLTLRAAHPDVRFSPADRVRFRRAVAAADEVEVLAGGYRRGCYAVRNDFLVDRAALVVAWYDGSPGGTRYTLRRALARGREVWNLHPSGGGLAIRPVQPALF